MQLRQYLLYPFQFFRSRLQGSLVPVIFQCLVNSSVESKNVICKSKSKKYIVKVKIICLTGFELFR